MNFLFGVRYNLVDLAVMCAMAVLVSQKMIAAGLIVAVVGILISTAVQAWLEYNTKDRPWQELVKQGRYIDAIRQHRQIHGSTLRDAKDVIDAYRNQLR